MKRIIAIGLTFALGATLWAGSAAAEHISKPGGPPTPQRQAASEWVRFVDQGNQRAACELQTVQEVGGTPCSELSPGIGVHCPKHVLELKRSNIRRLDQRLGALTEETQSRAFVDFYPKLISRKVRAAIGLELVGGVWRISYIRQGSNVFAPAGTVVNSKTEGEMWGPVCYRTS